MFLVTPCDSLSAMVKHWGAYWVSSRLAMVVCRGWGPEVFLEPVTKGSAWFPCVFFWMVYLLAFKPIYNPTLLKFVVPVLVGHEKGFCGVSPFEMHLDPQVNACPFELFPQCVDVWYHYGDVFVVWFTVVVFKLVVLRGCTKCF